MIYRYDVGPRAAQAIVMAVASHRPGSTQARATRLGLLEGFRKSNGQLYDTIRFGWQNTDN